MKARRVLWVDATAGASGDMILGALVDLGVPVRAIRRAVESLPVEGWKIGARRVVRSGLAARKIDVRVREKGPERGWRAIRRIVGAGRLDPRVRDLALRVFRRLIEAEAEAHGVAADEVHLHEAGALDAIVDVVGAAVGLVHLAPSRIVVSRITTGHGRVECRHGSYPVPGPATTALLRGAPVTGGDAEGERLTPTGAAILTTVADAWGSLPPGRIVATGHGAGDREFPDRPNVLRMVLADEDSRAPGSDETVPGGEVLVLQATLDDAPPQVVAWAAERLFEAGALEVFTTPVQMKKGRPGHLLTALARPERLDALAEVVLRETTTLGLRFRRESRIELERTVRKVSTPFGPVRIKTGWLGGEAVQAWPEYEDCAAAARRHSVPLKRVQRAALEAEGGVRGPACRKSRRRPAR